MPLLQRLIASEKKLYLLLLGAVVVLLVLALLGGGLQGGAKSYTGNANNTQATPSPLQQFANAPLSGPNTFSTGQVRGSTTTNASNNIAAEGQAYVFSFMDAAAKAASCQVAACPDYISGNVAGASTSAFDGLVELTGTLYNTKQASVEVWASDLRESLLPSAEAGSLDSPTYNPGQGFELLSPVRELWRATSNIVYIFYIVIIVVIAFLIVFRTQLGGQNEINLFNAIPSIIISLILVFFSYPLSAAFIDIITIGSGVTYGVLIGTPGSNAPGAYLYEKDLKYDIGFNIPNFINGDRNTTFDARTGLQIDDKYVSLWQIMFSSRAAPDIEGVNFIVPSEAPFASIIKNFINSVDNLGGGILLLVFSFAAFTAQLNLFFKLVREYVVLTFYVVLAPFYFLAAAIPGQTGGMISGYFRRLLAASLCFVAVYAVFLVVLIVGNSSGQVGDVVWLPPLLGYSADSLPTGQTISNIARPILAFFLFLSTPMIPDAINQAIGAEGGGGAFFGNVMNSVRAGGAIVAGQVSSIDQMGKGALGIQPRKRG